MGELVNAVAIRGRDLVQVTEALVAVADDHFVASHVVPRPTNVPAPNAFVYPPYHSWTVVSFDGIAHLPLARVLSAEALVVAADIDDGDFWRHIVCRDGAVLDRFSSCRSNVGPDEDPGGVWEGDADTVAHALGIDVSVVEPFYVQDGPSGGDCWRWTELWAQFGIRVPGPDEAPVVAVEYGDDASRRFPEETTDF